MIRILRVVICTEKNGESAKLLADKYPNEVTELSLEQYKSKLREELNLASDIMIDVTYKKV